MCQLISQRKSIYTREICFRDDGLVVNTVTGKVPSVCIFFNGFGFLPRF